MNARCASPKTRISGCWYTTMSSQVSVDPLTSYQIVDSIMALFRTDFSGRGELSERQQKASLIFHFLNFRLTCDPVGTGTTKSHAHPSFSFADSMSMRRCCPN